MRKIIRRAAAVLLSAALLLTGTASAAARIDPVEERLAAMSLREKVGQLFVVRVEALDPSGQSDSTRLTWAERQGLKKYPVGGIVVFRQNVKSPEQLKKLLADFQAASGTGLLTAVDEEGGSVARLANASGFDLPQYQSAQAVGTTGDPANARAMGQIVGGYLKTYGLNLDFAPVADVNTNPANTVIGNRAFSSDPAVAAQMVASAVQGFHDAGILCTLKHFPGHGDTARGQPLRHGQQHQDLGRDAGDGAEAFCGWNRSWGRRSNDRPHHHPQCNAGRPACVALLHYADRASAGGVGLYWGHLHRFAVHASHS